MIIIGIDPGASGFLKRVHCDVTCMKMAMEGVIKVPNDQNCHRQFQAEPGGQVTT